MDTSEILALVEEAATSKQFSAHTVKAYRRIWVKFLAQAAAADLSVPSLPRAKAREIYVELAGARSPSHHLQVKAALSFLYQVLDKANPFVDCLAPRFDIEKTEIKYLSSAQVGLVLARMRAGDNEYYARLAATLAAALFLTATRFHEWATLTRDRLAWSGGDPVLGGTGGSLVVRFKTKGARFSDVKVGESFAKSLQDWLVFLDAFKGVRLRAGSFAFSASPYVFPGRDGEPYTNEAFNLRLKAACRECHVPVISAHGLRHAAATALLNEKKMNLKEVQEMLKHKNIATTARYTHVEHERLTAMVEGLEGLL